MMADAAPAHPTGLNFATRLSATHAAELQGFINAAVNRWNKPVWVVGTSNGSISTVTAGGFLPALAGLSGVLLTSPVTALAPGPQPAVNLFASRIVVPALVVSHQDDHCSFSPPAGAAVLFALIPSANKAARTFEHGHSVATDPCGAFSEHGYAGIEDKVVKKIAEFIRGEDADCPDARVSAAKCGVLAGRPVPDVASLDPGYDLSFSCALAFSSYFAPISPPSCPRLSRASTSFVRQEDVDGRDISAFTRVFDALLRPGRSEPAAPRG